MIMLIGLVLGRWRAELLPRQKDGVGYSGMCDIFVRAPVVLTALIERKMCCTGLIFLWETYVAVFLQEKMTRLQKDTGNSSFRARIDSGLSLKETCIKSYYTSDQLLVFPPKCFSDVHSLVLRLSHSSSPMYSASKMAAMA